MLCPKCDSLMVSRRPDAGPLDAVLALCSLVPFECQACRHRFRARQSTPRGATGTEDRRKIARRPVQVPVRFECGEVAGEGMLTDLSKDGCTLDSKRRLRTGLLLRVHLPASTDQAPQATATHIATVRSVVGSRAGLKFLAFTPPEQIHLEQTITSTIKRFTGGSAGPAKP